MNGKSQKPRSRNVIRDSGHDQTDHSAETPVRRDSTGKEEERGHWDNHLQFLLTCIGLAVGLGNIWKFPVLAYDNGGSAFLFPYVTCSVFFGLPMVYCEFLIGQYVQAGPARAFKRIAPALQGVGWGMAILSGTVAIYYTVVIAWAGVYMAFIVLGRSHSWTECGNEWNDEFCIQTAMNQKCMEGLISSGSSSPYITVNDPNAYPTAQNNSMYYLGSCIEANSSIGSKMKLPAEQFFKNYIVDASSGITDFGGVNWPVLSSLVIMWIIVAVTLIKGIELMGKAAYVTATVPYVIIAILFVRGVTLEGAGTGINYYLGQPKWEKILTTETWKVAIMQVCFSISIGYGALIALSSFSKRDNNCFRDACIIICGDTFMSVFGGVAVFSTLGFLAKAIHRDIDDVVVKGPSLAFIVYPEAISRMPVAPLFAMLFFLMLFCLGISSEVALVEVLITSINEQFPKIGKKRWMLVVGVCLFYLSLGLIMATGCGWYWFNIYDDFTGSTAAVLIVAIEAIMMGWIYGIDNAAKDIERIFGVPPKNLFLKMVGPHSPYLRWMWRTVCPVAAIAIAVFTCIKEPMNDKERNYAYPFWSQCFGWFLALCPLIAIPIFAYVNIREMQEKNKNWTIQDLFKVTPDHPSYSRIQEEKDQRTMEHATA